LNSGKADTSPSCQVWSMTNKLSGSFDSAQDSRKLTRKSLASVAPKASVFVFSRYQVWLKPHPA
jgi:hypothetical protein